MQTAACRASVLHPHQGLSTVVPKPETSAEGNSPMESSPFKDLIRALATAQQNQYQVLVALRKEQEQWFEALVLAQQEGCQAFWHLLVSAGSTTATGADPPHLTLTKMGPRDDPEAFLVLFEEAAEAWGWPVDQRAARPLPLLTGQAQLAVLQLPANSRLMYVDLRRAILQHAGRSPEQQRQRFRSLCLEEVGQPFGQQLWDTCWQWLRADNRDAEGVIDLVPMGQFVARLPEGTAEWVQCPRPALLDQAIELAEDHMVAVPTAGRHVSSSVFFLCFPSSPHSPTAEACSP
ncbi:uncharacterized protein LOC132892529 [Neoarius graeffei]|uniref:uncharacterized protein LOC132892529 n=1 Tax=Neoarius graeffei TaxID=443677 RepID=UPI00298CAF07|nr:uncharacterized protein LOC132892529 [Neoarius graeffei]